MARDHNVIFKIRSQALTSHVIPPHVRAEQKRRMYAARAALEQREEKRVSLDEIGRRVALALRRAQPFANTVVRKWIEGMSEPENVMTWLALAYVFGVSPSWLAFDEGTMWGTTKAAPPRVVGGVPFEDGVESERAISAREAAPRPAPRAAAGRSGPATGGADRASSAPSRARRPKR